MKKTKRANAVSLVVFSIFMLTFSVGCGGGGGLGVGNRGGDVNAPVLTMSNPEPDGRVSDMDFHSGNFYMQFSYNDGSPMVISTLSVTMKMDTGSAQDITSYFSQTDSSTIKSSNLYNYTRTLFMLQTNDTSHSIAVTISIQDTAQNTGNTSAGFTVYPVGPGIGPPE